MVHQDQGKLVQEVAAGGLPAPPSRYVLKEEVRPTGGVAASELAFPTVDLQRLAEPGDVEEAAKLRSALDSWGLFAVTGHGVPEELLDGILDATREFFHLPAEAKLEYANRTDDGDAEGYGIDRVDTDEQVLDWCDRLYLTVQPDDERQPRFWPPSLADLLHEYTPRSERVARQVLRAMATALGFREEFFLDRVGEHGNTYARFSYYPPCPRPELVYGLKPHTDNSVVTVLLLDRDVGGLQVFKQDDGRWVDVPVFRRHELLVVVGEEMELMSNAAFIAPTHRVVTGDRERMSLAMFCQPEPHLDLQPAEELVDETRPAMYRKLKAKTFGDGFFDAFALGERTLDFLKVTIDNKDAVSSA